MGSTDSAFLTVRGLWKAFDGLDVLCGVDLTCSPCEVKALVGPNGAGKTTIFDIVSGYVSPDRGDVLLCGESIVGWQPHAIARSGIGRSFQNLRLFENLTTLDNVLVAMEPRANEELVSTFLARKRITAAERALEATAADLLAEVALLPHAGKRAGDLSHGQKKLLAFVRTLALSAQVVLLDEPSAGLAPEMAERVTVCIHRAAMSGKGILLIEHDLAFVARVAQKVALLSNGRVAFEGVASEVLDDARLRSAFLGEAPLALAAGEP